MNSTAGTLLLLSILGVILCTLTPTSNGAPPAPDHIKEQLKEVIHPIKDLEFESGSKSVGGGRQGRYYPGMGMYRPYGYGLGGGGGASSSSAVAVASSSSVNNNYGGYYPGGGLWY